MALHTKGQVIVGEKARAKITEEIILKSDLNTKELEFILRKLQDATYKGHEFEMFYTTWVKLTEKLKQTQQQ